MIPYSLALPIVQIFVQTDVRIFYKPVTKYKLENGERKIMLTTEKARCISYFRFYLFLYLTQKELSIMLRSTALGEKSIFESQAYRWYNYNL